MSEVNEVQSSDVTKSDYSNTNSSQNNATENHYFSNELPSAGVNILEERSLSCVGIMIVFIESIFLFKRLKNGLQK